MLSRTHWHKSLTDMAIAGAVERTMQSLDNPGFCLVCGNEADGCEPDAPTQHSRSTSRPRWGG
jgi:hypothetical protein